MSVETAAGAALSRERIDQQVTAARVRLINAQVRTAPLATMCADGLIVYLLARDGLGAWVWPWYALCVLAHGVRPVWFSRVARQPEGRERWLVAHTHVFMGIFGVLRLTLVPIAFSLPLSSTHYVYTMVFTGIAAGIVITAAGSLKIYATWLVPSGAALALAWMSRGTFEGVTVGLLLLMLYSVLLRNVREQGRMLRDFVVLAAEKEQLATGLRVERDRAQAANESKTRFFAAANHDLRQPLHALAINASALEMVARKHSDGMVRELSAGISRALAQSNDLLDNLLDISRLDAHAVQLHIEPLSLGALLRRLRDEYTPVAASAGLSLRLELPPTQDPAVPLRVNSDELLLRRVLGNLLSNALKFTRQGEVVLGAHCPPGQDRVVLTVQDSGPGIAPEHQERVFEEFFQVGNQSRDRNQGLGLGLPIVKRVCALLGIELSLHSHLGEGTCVTLRLPRAQAVVVATAPEVLPELPTDEAQPLNARVLAIDDEPDVLRSLELLLPQFGCEVRCAADSHAAQAHLDAGFCPTLLLVDHRLRNETGIELIPQLRQRLGPVPAILITGDTSPAHIQQTLSIGSRVLHKPLDGMRLRQAMAEVLTHEGR